MYNTTAFRYRIIPSHLAKLNSIISAGRYITRGQFRYACSTSYVRTVGWVMSCWLALIYPQAVSMYSAAQHTRVMTNFYSYIVDLCYTRSDQLLCSEVAPEEAISSTVQHDRASFRCRTSASSRNYVILRLHCLWK